MICSAICESQGGDGWDALSMQKLWEAYHIFSALIVIAHELYALTNNKLACKRSLLFFDSDDVHTSVELRSWDWFTSLEACYLFVVIIIRWSIKSLLRRLISMLYLARDLLFKITISWRSLSSPGRILLTWAFRVLTHKSPFSKVKFLGRAIVLAHIAAICFMRQQNFLQRLKVHEPINVGFGNDWMDQWWVWRKCNRLLSTLKQFVCQRL